METSENIERALSVLHEGGIVAHATETCYGLACDMTNPKAVAKLFAAKQRSHDQPVSALFSSLEEANKYVEWNDEAQKLADEHLPGPLTIILPIRADVQVFPTPNLDPHPTLGIRISSHPIAQQLASRFGKPLSTTSANVHGKPNPYSKDKILEQFANLSTQPDLILDSGPLPEAPPSTVIDLSKKEREILRQGPLTFI